MKTPSEERKPAVFLFLAPPVGEDFLAPILWGLEEEGVPAEILERAGAPAPDLAREASLASLLNVGIGINGHQGQASLHHRDLANRAPLLSIQVQRQGPETLRGLGANAARLVKGNPLIMEAPGLPEPGTLNIGCGLRESLREGQTVELIARVVLELLKDNAGASHVRTESWSY